MEDNNIIDEKIISIIIQLSDTIRDLQDTLSNKFYNRRKTAILEYNKQLNILIDKITKLNIMADGTKNDYLMLDKQYSESWAKKDFYSIYKTWFGSIVYDYSSSIDYHRNNRIAIELINICSDNLTKIIETKECINLKTYCTKIDLSLVHVIQTLVKINSEINNINTDLKNMMNDDSTKRYY